MNITRKKILLSIFSTFSVLFAFSQSEFITVWKPSNPSTTISGYSVSTATQAYFPGIGTNYTIYWEEVGYPAHHATLNNVTTTQGNPVLLDFGASSNPISANATYTVKVTNGSGSFTQIMFADENSDAIYGDAEKIVEVSQWGLIHWEGFEMAFTNCSNMDVTATDVPDLTVVNRLMAMFYGCTSLKGNASFNNWNTSNIIDMHAMFAYASSFNQPIGNWNTSNVTDMSTMFAYASSFNQPIGNWNTSKVQYLYYMFALASSFNQPIGNWNTSGVVEMDGMFGYASSFNQPIGNWNTANVEIMAWMFYNASAFNQPLGNWNTAKVTDMGNIFQDASAFNQPIGNWNLSSVTNMGDMLSSSGMDCPTYTSTLIGWANSATTPSNMSLGATGLTYGSSAVAARNTLIAKGWTITGDAAGSCLPLPVLFGNVSAVLKNGELLISWTTLTESNSDHFAIEVSKDGKTFTTVKSVISKATNEVSDHRIDYDVTIPISNSSLAWIFLPTAFGAALLTNRKRVKILILLSVLGISFFVNSCSKKDSQNTVNASHNFWVRIVQVDKSGAKQYSKIIKAVKE